MWFSFVESLICSENRLLVHRTNCNTPNISNQQSGLFYNQNQENPVEIYLKCCPTLSNTPNISNQQSGLFYNQNQENPVEIYLKCCPTLSTIKS